MNVVCVSSKQSKQKTMADFSIAAYVKSEMVSLLRCTITESMLDCEIEADPVIAQRVKDYVAQNEAGINAAVEEMISDFTELEFRDINTLHPTQQPPPGWFAEYLFAHVDDTSILDAESEDDEDD
jgi:hypothetical protein